MSKHALSLLLSTLSILLNLAGCVIPMSKEMQIGLLLLAVPCSAFGVFFLLRAGK